MSTTLPTVAVIGSGTMGAGIAEVAAAAGHPVLIYDIAPEAVVRAIDGIRWPPASAAASWRRNRPGRCCRVWHRLRI